MWRDSSKLQPNECSFCVYFNPRNNLLKYLTRVLKHPVCT